MREKHKKSHAKMKTKHSSTESDEEKSSKELKGELAWRDVAIISVFGAVALLVYVYTMYPSISGGDSGELVTAAHELGVAHPPGYPLFTMLVWVAIQIVPTGDVAWRANLLNAVFASAASVLLALTIYRLTKSACCSVFGSSLWSFSKLTWTWSASAEVFALNNLFTTALIYLSLIFHQSQRDKKMKVAYLGTFVCGLAMCNQHTIVVYVSVIALWVLTELYKDKLLSLATLLRLGLCFLTGLVPYVYLPLSTLYSNGRWTWGDQSTWSGFLHHILRTEYGTFDLAKGQDGGESKLLYNLNGYVEHCMDEFTILGVILCLVGSFYAFKRFSRYLLTIMGMCALYMVLFSWRANLPIDNPLFLGVVERFWMQADCVIALLAATGLHCVLSFVQKKCPQIKLFELAMAIIVGAAQMQRNFGDCNHRNNTVVAEFGARLYDNMPQNALVLLVGDLPSNLLRYMYLCGNNRPDVQVLDSELMTYPWFVPMLRDAYPNISFPGDLVETKTGLLEDGRMAFTFKTFLDEQYKKYPIVGCIGIQEKERSWMSAYDKYPYGPCFILIKKGQPIQLEQMLPALAISSGWKHPFEGFDKRTWERVATDEMWSAKVNIPFMLYETAVKLETTKPEHYSSLMIQSYQLYKQAVEAETTATIPYYWHTNFALACERMLRLEHKHSKSTILNETIFHFESSVQKNPTDKDVPIIKQSIEHLKKMVGKIT